MKALHILKVVLKDTIMPSEKKYINEAIEELEELQNRSCDGCIHKNSEGVMEYSCFECSRYYADRYKTKDKQ